MQLISQSIFHVNFQKAFSNLISKQEHRVFKVSASNSEA